MKTPRTTTGLLIIVVLAFLGFLLVYIPPQLATHYQALSGQHPQWARVYLVAVISGAVLLLITTVWIVAGLALRSRRKRARRERLQKNPSQLSAGEKQQEVAENLASLASLREDAAVSDELRRELEALTTRLDEKQKDQQLELVAFGAISSGKSSLLNMLAGRDVFRTDAKGGTTVRRGEIPWPGADRVVLVDTPGLGEIDGAERVRMSTEAARDADLVLMVVDGPLRDFEHDLLRRLAEMEKRVLLCLNKVDWYDEDEQQALRGQLAAQLKGVVEAEDVVSVAAQPVKRMRVRVRADGSQLEEEVHVPADISCLAERMMQVVRRDGRDLLLANLLLQSRGVVEQARERVQEALDRRAGEIVEKYMWGAGGAAALSPLPLLDLAAGGAITVKMVLDLAKVYRQDVDMEAAVQLLAQLGKNLVAILGVSLATPAVVTAVASMLKTIPGVGTLAGGMLQGLVQAVVTRWIGRVFMQYFKKEMQADEQGLAMLARQQWEFVTSVTELRKLVQSARANLMASSKEPS